MLYLAQRGAWVQGGDEEVRITFGGGQGSRIVECQVLAVLFAELLRPNQGTFTRFPGAVD
jgi:hypothetical protein